MAIRAVHFQGTGFYLHFKDVEGDFAFDFTAPDTYQITRASGSFVTDGLKIGQAVFIDGSEDNRRPFEVLEVSALTLTVVQAVVDEVLPTGVTTLQVFHAIGDVKQGDGPGGDSSEIDVTHSKSTAKEYLLGLQDFGEVSLTANELWGDDGHEAIYAAAKSREAVKCLIFYPNGGARIFDAYMKPPRPSGGVDGAYELAITLRVTGEPERILPPA